MLIHCLLLIMCRSHLLHVVHCSLCAAHVCKLLTAHHGWCVLVVVQCSLCVVHYCCMLLAVHYACVLHACSSMLYVAHCSLGAAYVYFMLFIAHYLSFMFDKWCSLLLHVGFLCSLYVAHCLQGTHILCVAYSST